MIEFHVCPDNGCCAFVGNFTNCVACPYCGAYRFTKSTNRDCRFLNYEECTHTINNRVSNKSLFFGQL
jgi:hypothetical protein